MEERAPSLTVFSRHYYIQKKYQSRMVLKFCLLALMGTVFFCVSFYAVSNRELAGGYARALDAMRYVQGGLAGKFFLSGVLVIFLSSVCVILLTLFMSHKIAGPLWRVRQVAREVGEGNLAVRLQLREHDEVKALADQMNKMVAGLRAQVLEIKAGHDAFERGLRSFEDLCKDGAPPEQRMRHARGLAEAGGELAKKTGGIRTN